MISAPPEFRVKSFNCPHCNAFSHMDWNEISSIQYQYKLTSATCSCCTRDSIWLTNLSTTNNAVIKNIMISPQKSFSTLPHDDMPEEIKADFNEARAVYHISPKAAAALLRLGLQKLCKHLGEPGENINIDIKSLVAKGILNAGITKAADTVRIVGNNAVHPGEMNGDDVDYIASKLFDLLNFIVKKTITEPKELEDLYNMTPENKRKGIEVRDRIATTPTFSSD